MVAYCIFVVLDGAVIIGRIQSLMIDAVATRYRIAEAISTFEVRSPVRVPSRLCPSSSAARNYCRIPVLASLPETAQKIDVARHHCGRSSGPNKRVSCYSTIEFS